MIIGESVIPLDEGKGKGSMIMIKVVSALPGCYVLEPYTDEKGYPILIPKKRYVFQTEPGKQWTSYAVPMYKAHRVTVKGAIIHRESVRNEISLRRVQKENPHGTNWKAIGGGFYNDDDDSFGEPFGITQYIDFECAEGYRASYIKSETWCNGAWCLGAN